MQHNIDTIKEWEVVRTCRKECTGCFCKGQHMLRMNHIPGTKESVHEIGREPADLHIPSVLIVAELLRTEPIQRPYQGVSNLLKIYEVWNDLEHTPTWGEDVTDYDTMISRWHWRIIAHLMLEAREWQCKLDRIEADNERARQEFEINEKARRTELHNAKHPRKLSTTSEYSDISDLEMSNSQNAKEYKRNGINAPEEPDSLPPQTLQYTLHECR